MRASVPERVCERSHAVHEARGLFASERADHALVERWRRWRRRGKRATLSERREDRAAVWCESAAAPVRAGRGGMGSDPSGTMLAGGASAHAL